MSILYMYNKGIERVSEVNRRLNSTTDYYIYEINKSLLELDLIKQEKLGRTIKIILTEKGKKVADNINGIFEVLNINDELFHKKEEIQKKEEMNNGTI